MVMVPLGMMLQPGMRATLYPKDMWEKVQKNEKIDESQAQGAAARLHALPSGRLHRRDGGDARALERPEEGRRPDGVCHQCAGAPVGFPVPLDGFEQAYAGAPVDNKEYGEARRSADAADRAAPAGASMEETEAEQTGRSRGGAPLRRRPLLPGAARQEVTLRPCSPEQADRLLAGRPFSLCDAAAPQCGCCRNSGR